MKIQRKLIAGGFAAIAGLLLVSGVAHACVPFKGKLSTTVSANGQPNTVGNSGVHSGDGSINHHSYCATSTEITPDTAATAGAGNVLSITLAAGTTCSGSLSGTQTVYLNNATTDAASPFSASGTSWSFRTGTECWFSPTPRGRISLGTMGVVSGAGTRTLTLPNTLNRVDSAGLASSLCVGTSTTGMIIPVVINDVQI